MEPTFRVSFFGYERDDYTLGEDEVCTVDFKTARQAVEFARNLQNNVGYTLGEMGLCVTDECSDYADMIIRYDPVIRVDEVRHIDWVMWRED